MNQTPHSHSILYLSHGAGPLPILGDEGHMDMIANLKAVAADMPRPSAIVLVSAHWEASRPTLTNGPNPSLLYDYYGFPQEAYELEYPAPGSPALCDALGQTLDRSGLSCDLDAERGFDHGMFIPLMIMYPEADIPCVQLSMVKGLDPALHMDMGQALSRLEQENLLIIGSGFSFHNMRAFFQEDTPETRAWNEAFDSWLRETCSGDMEETERRKLLENWESAPHARYCHPREDHLLPLHVCCGAAGRACTRHYDLDIFGKKAITLLW